MRTTNFLVEQQVKICELVAITAEDYRMVVFNTGVDLIHYQLNNTALADKILASETYWQWYMNQFAIVDEHFIFKFTYEGTSIKIREDLKGLWFADHQPEKLEYYPGPAVFKESNHFKVSN